MMNMFSGGFWVSFRWVCFFFVMGLSLFPFWTLAGDDINSVPLQVTRLGAGTHKMNQVVLSSPHAVLQGEGKGVTILVVPNGVLCTGTNPIIRDLTIVGEGRGVGLTLRNTWSAQVTDVAVESFATGIRLELNEEGRKRVGTTKRGWPSALTNGQWGSRMTLTELRGVNITGQGEGLAMYNYLKDGNKGVGGEFFTATTVWGGHIAVQGKAVVIGDNVWNTKIIGTYIDIGVGGGIYLEKNAWDLALVGVALDMSRSARTAGALKIYADSERAAKSIQHVATTLEEKEIMVNKQSWLNRLKD